MNFLFKELNLFFSKMTGQSIIQNFNLNNRVQIFDQIFIRDSIRMLNNTFINFNQNGKILFTDKDENNNETTMDLSTLISNNIIQIFQNTTLPSLLLSQFIGLVNTSGLSEIYNVANNTINIRFDPQPIPENVINELYEGWGGDLILPAGTTTAPSYGPDQVPNFKGVLKIDANFNNNDGKDIAYNTYLVDSENLMYAIWNTQYIKMQDLSVTNLWINGVKQINEGGSLINHGNITSYKPINLESSQGTNKTIVLDGDSGITYESINDDNQYSIKIENASSISISEYIESGLCNESKINYCTIKSKYCLANQNIKLIPKNQNNNNLLSVGSNGNQNCNFDFIMKINTYNLTFNQINNINNISSYFPYPEFILNLNINDEYDFLCFKIQDIISCYNIENIDQIYNKYFRIIITISNYQNTTNSINLYNDCHLEYSFSNTNVITSLKKISKLNSDNNSFILDFIIFNSITINTVVINVSDNDNLNIELTINILQRVMPSEYVLEGNNKFELS